MRTGLVILSIIGLAEAGRRSQHTPPPPRSRFGLDSLDRLKERLPRIQAPWARDEDMYEVEEEEEEMALGGVAKAVIGATLTAAGSVGASFAYRLFQSKQQQQQGSVMDTMPKMPKGGIWKRSSPSTPTAPAAPASSAAPAADKKKTETAAPKTPAAAAAASEEGEEEKQYDLLPVEQLDESTLTTEQKEHFKAKMLGSKLVKYEDGKLVERPTKDVLEGKHTFLFFYHPDVDDYMRKAGLPSSLSGMTALYKKLQEEGKPFEFVFISLVRPEGRFHETLKGMPWYAVAQSEKDRIISIIQTLQVHQFPSMVILDEENRLLNLKGYQYMLSDSEGFPWNHKTVEQLLGDKLVDRNGEEHSVASAIKDKKSVALYFSASWCKPCREFTPKLVELYNKKKAEGEDFEVIFVSLDHEEEKMKEYLQEMPWLAIPFSEKGKRTLLMTELGVAGIPTLVTMNDKLKVITTRAREFIAKDPEGTRYPWVPQAVNELGWSHDGIVQYPSLVVFMENADADVQASVVQALEKIGQEHEAGLKIDPDDPLAQAKFFYAKEVSTMSSALRSLASLPAVNPKDKFLKGKHSQGKKPIVALMDIQKQSYHVSSDLDSVGEAEIRAILKQYYEDSLPMEAIKIETATEAPAAAAAQATGGASDKQ